jgi:membrane protein DedA with SNARE-associated domain
MNCKNTAYTVRLCREKLKCLLGFFVTFHSFLQDYGYWAIFLGAMIEGESIILTASALAALGTFSIVKVMLITFVGTLLADQALYFVGVAYGMKFLTQLKRQFPALITPMEKGLFYLKRYETLYILSFRFIYGIRIISPILIGAQHVGFQRFACLNLIAAAGWTLMSCTLGYFLGEALGHFTKNIGFIIAGVLVVVILLSIVLHFRKKRKSIQKD